MDKMQNLLKEGLDIVAEGFSIYDNADRLVYYNKAYLKLYPSNRGKEFIILGEKFEDIIRKAANSGQYAEAIGRVDEWIEERMLRHKNPTGVGFEQELSNGSWLLVLEHKTQSGYIVGSRIDITNIKRAELNLDKAFRELEKALQWEAIGQLSAGIAHEINTPSQYINDNLKFLEQAMVNITPILSICKKLKSNNISAKDEGECEQQIINLIKNVDLEFLMKEIPSAIAQSKSGIDHVQSIVNAMKDYSYKQSKEIRNEDINHTIESAIAISRNLWKYVADIKTEFDPTLQTIKCIRGEIGQVILNLIINAAHAIEDKKKVVPIEDNFKGKIVISTKRTDKWAEIRIADNANGIPKNIEKKVFRPFFTTKDVGKGTGQGLALSYSIIINNHNGLLTFDTEIGVGTTFLIQVPI